MIRPRQGEQQVDVGKLALHPLDDERFPLVARNLHGHKQVTDAYLIQLARDRDLRLATFDRRLEAVSPFPDLVRVLEV